VSTLHLPNQNTPAARIAVDECDQLTLAWLLHEYPALFSIHHSTPLAIGIRNELRKVRPGTVSNASLRRVLAQWCWQPGYLKAVATTRHRYGLNGESGCVSRQHRGRARALLKKRKAGGR